MSPRARAFFVVGAIGFCVQLVALYVITRAGIALPIATALAVETAVLHNFLWHQRWTWRDRRDETGAWGRLWRFHSSNAVVSLAVNVGLTWMFARLLHLPPLVANAVAVALAAGANFSLADRWVFRRGAPVAIAAAVLAASTASEAAPASAVAAWDQHVRNAETRQATSQPQCDPAHEPAGASTKVADGTIYRWSSCMVVKGITVAELVNALIASGTPPPQDDVLEARLMERNGDHLRVYLKLKREALITVSYDTEHDVTFQRTSPQLASSRSVATSIAQIGGGDHGFLWRLNSYWTYRQVGDDVRVELVSLSLSRDVPLLARPVAGPIVNRVARDSMQRTLAAVRDFASSTTQASAARSSVTQRRADAP